MQIHVQVPYLSDDKILNNIWLFVTRCDFSFYHNVDTVGYSPVLCVGLSDTITWEQDQARK